MQLAVPEVNAQNAQDGLPAIGIGIGISTGEVVAGNIGSEQRTTYSVLGSVVNLAARIESYCTEGQVLVSEATRAALGEDLVTRGSFEVEPKGVGKRVRIYDVLKLEGLHGCSLPEDSQEVALLAPPATGSCWLIKNKQTIGYPARFAVIYASETFAHLAMERPLPAMTDLSLRFCGPDGFEQPTPAFGKVTAQPPGDGANVVVRFTEIAPDLRALLKSLAHPGTPTDTN